MATAHFSFEMLRLFALLDNFLSTVNIFIYFKIIYTNGIHWKRRLFVWTDVVNINPSVLKINNGFVSITYNSTNVIWATFFFDYKILRFADFDKYNKIFKGKCVA